MQRLIHSVKYRNQTAAAAVLGRGLGELLEQDDPAPAVDLVLSVPLHSSRRRERGYNQSDLIARAVGGVLRLPVEERTLRRMRATPTQTTLGLDEREANVADAFQVRRPLNVAGRRILLVDDVVTTGATANACTEALLQAGAASVRVAAIACPYLDAEGS